MNRRTKSTENQSRIPVRGLTHIKIESSSNNETNGDEELARFKAICASDDPPTYKTAKGHVLNERFWAELYRQEHEILFAIEENAFFQYNHASGLSDRISDDAIKVAISKRISEVSKTWKEFAHLRPMSNQRNVISVISPLKAKTEVYKAFELSETIIACRNCLLRLDGGEFVREEFSPKYRLRHKSPYDYDPSARCEEFKRHLLSHLEEDDRLVLQKLAGQALTGRNLCQRMAILDGVSDAGKTTWVMTIVGLLGIDHCAQLRTAQLETRFEAARIASAYLLYGPDVKGNFLSHPSANIIKSMVGGDSLDLEFQNSNDNKTKRRGYFPIFVTSNSRLFVWFDGDYDAWRRRLVVIRYEQPKLQQTIRDFDKWILDREGSGILNWCVEGVKLLLKDTARTGDICLSDNQKALVDKLIYESDSLADFVRTQIYFVGRGSEGLASTEILEKYLKYCQEKDWRPMPISKVKSDIPDLMARYFGISKGTNVVRFNAAEGKDGRVNGYLQVEFVSPFPKFE